MSVANTLDRVARWLREEVCPKVHLKPHDGPGAPQDGRWEYELVTPEVFTLFVPTSKTKPPGVKTTVPAIVVELMSGADHLQQEQREITLRLSFTTWDPGLHGPDILRPDPETGRTKPDPEGTLQPNHEGWRDAINFLDTTLREIESHETVDGMPIVREPGPTFGLYDYEDAPADFYPFWLAWAQITLIELNVRHRKDFDEYL